MHRWVAIIPALLATLSSFAATDTKPTAPSAAVEYEYTRRK